MNFNDYQKKALTTAYTYPKYKGTLMENTIWAMGLAGEAGEFLEKWKKIIAYKHGKLGKEDKELLKKELGDVVWYIAVMADSLGMTLEDVMQLNVKKLADRKTRGVIMGQGDNR